MQRRQFLTSASATMAAASLAGCSGILGGGGGGGSSGSEAAVEGYFDASQDGDTEAVQEYVHPDGDFTPTTASEGSGDFEVSLESTEVVEESEEQATVAADFEISGGGDSSIREIEYDVRMHEGEWKIYSSSTASTGAN